MHRIRIPLSTAVLGLILLGSPAPSGADQRAWTREATQRLEGDPYDPHSASPGAPEIGLASRGAAGTHSRLLSRESTACLIRGFVALIR